MEAFSTSAYAVARTHLESAVNNIPDFAPAYLGLGLVLEELAEYEAAQSYLEHVLELDPGNFMARHALGRVQDALSTDS